MSEPQSAAAAGGALVSAVLQHADTHTRIAQELKGLVEHCVEQPVLIHVRGINKQLGKSSASR